MRIDATVKGDGHIPIPVEERIQENAVADAASQLLLYLLADDRIGIIDRHPHTERLLLRIEILRFMDIRDILRIV